MLNTQLESGTEKTKLAYHKRTIQIREMRGKKKKESIISITLRLGDLEIFLKKKTIDKVETGSNGDVIIEKGVKV